MNIVRTVLLILLAALMIFAGAFHFYKPGPYVKIMPEFLPFPLALVYISGFFEILGGVGLLVPVTRPFAAWGLVVLFLAVFPANINMAVNQISLGDTPTAPWLLWLRLPIQFVFIYWAWYYTRK